MSHGGTCNHLEVYRLLLVILAAALIPDPAPAQFSQYRPPGKLDPVGESGSSSAADTARWQLGPLGIDPLLALGNLSYVQNVFASSEASETVSDYRGTISAGLRAYLPVGSNALITTFVLPNYTWWLERKELRTLSWNAGATAEIQLNRLTLAVGAREVTVERFLNSELDVPAEIQTTNASFSFELELRGPWQLFGSVGRNESRHAVRDPILASRSFEVLDRTDQVARIGLGYELGNGLLIRLGGEFSESDFFDSTSPRSNKSARPRLEVSLQGNHLDVQLAASSGSTEYSSGSKQRSDTGRLQVGVKVTSRLRVTPYFYRSLVYSARDANSVFTEDRLGMSVGVRRSERLTLRLFLDSGDNRFRGVDSGSQPRVDRVDAYGGGFELKLTEQLRLRFSAAQIEYRSPLAELNRSASRVGTEIVLQGFSLLPD